MSERWLPVPGAPDYAVSDHGNVRRIVERPGIKPAAMLKHKRRGKGGQYPGVDLRIGGKKVAFYVHRLVALAFLGPPPSERHEVAHGDGNPQNPRLNNLRWAIPVDNNADKHRHGTAQFGDRNSNRKLSSDQVREIRSSAEDHRALAARYPVTARHIKEIKAGQFWPGIS